MNDDNPSYEELERRCRRAEARLEALRGKGSADRHRVIFEKSPLGMIRFSPDGTILDCNQRFVDFMGSSREKLIGFNTARQSTPEMRRTIRKALAGDTAAYENEYTSVTGGKTLCLRAVFNPVHPGRSPTEVIAALEDVSERKAAEKALKKTESLLNEAQRIARIASYERNIETGQGWWSDEHYRLLGYEPGEVAHSFEFFLSHIHEGDRGNAEKILRTAYERMTPFAYDCRYIRRDGEIRYAHHTGMGFLGEDGKSKWLRGTFQDITERKRVEEALKRSEERYRDIFYNSLWGIFQSTVEGQFLSCNAAFAKTFGYDSPEDLVSAITDISRQYYVEPADRRRYIRLLEENGIVENYEFKARRKDGSEIWVNNSTRVVRDDAGRLMYYEGAVTDITARKQAEHALKASEARHRIIFEKSPLGMVRFSPDGAIRDCNEKFVQLMGASREKLIGFNMAAQSTPEMRRTVHKALAGETAVYENEYTSITGGKSTWLRAVFSPITPDRSPTEVIAALEDITERKRAERRLKESEERYRRLTENAQDIIWRTDWRGQVVFVNSAVQTLLGYSPGEIAGLDISQYMANSSIEQMLEKTNAIQLDRNSENHFRLEIDYIAKSGETRPFEINVVAMRGADGGITGYEGVSRDIAERKRMERDLIEARESAEAASRAKSEFIANMSHELRTPLNAILGYGQILLRDETLSEIQRQNIAVMRTSGEHLLTLINDILDIAKIEAGKLKIEFGPTDLRALIANVAAMLRAKAFKKQIQLVETIDPELPRFVEADEKRLRQVLLNLLSNAVKFTKEGSATLRARPAGDRIAFSVSDTGVGIPEDKITAAFDAFQQLAPIADKTEGTGLGLTISQNLVKLMGGRITVDSTVGRGSVFGFQIPLVDLNGKHADGALEEIHAPEIATEIGHAETIGPIVPPPKTDIAALHAMSRIGDLSAVVDYAAKIRETDPQAEGFCRAIEQYAAECDVTAIRKLIEGYMGGEK
jgi:PAS domain S-box-containing protein